MVFREMVEDDLHFFLKIRNSVSFEFLHNSKEYTIDECKIWFQSKKDDYYIIEYDNNNIGYFRTSNLIDNETIYIGADLDVNYRGKGLGFICYNLFIPFIVKKHNLKKINLEVLETNNVAINLYKKLGFIIYKEEPFNKNNIIINNYSMVLIVENYNINYIVALYFGDRRRFSNYGLNYLTEHVNFLKNNPKHVKKCTFVINETEGINKTEIINKIKEITEINVNYIFRENINYSYGAWETGILSDTSLQYSFLIEDDYLPIKHNFLDYFLTKIDNNTIFVCQQIFENPKQHAAISNGLFNNNLITNKTSIFDLNFQNGYNNADSNQLNFLNKFTNTSILKDISDITCNKFADLNTIKIYGNTNKPEIIIPI